MYDAQGMSLPQKLGGWARFYASQITAGVVRALWGWQDTNDNQWLALGADNASGSGLEVVQCTVNGTTGLTTATGTLTNITPFVDTAYLPVEISSTAGSNIFSVTSVPAFLQGSSSLYFTNPVSVGGVVLGNNYPIVVGSQLPTQFQISAYDVLGNPLNATYSTLLPGVISITGVTFTAGTPNTLTVAFTGAGYVFPIGENVRLLVADNSITGDYIVLSSAANSVTVATTLSSYTFATSGTVNNTGVVPIFSTTASSATVTVTFPDHGLVVGAYFDALNPTLVGGITIQGQYNVVTVPNGHTFTITSKTIATATSKQYQGALTATGGTLVRLTNNTYTAFNQPYIFNGTEHVLVQGVNPSDWNGTYNAVAGGAVASAMSYSNPGATGSYISGGSYSPVGGFNVFIYSVVSTTTLGTNTYSSSFWTLDSWGNDLIACSGNSVVIAYPNGYNVDYQPIFYWDSTGPYIYAQAIQTGPAVNTGSFVAMPQRQIIAWGSSFGGIIDPLLIRWCDVNNFNTWVAQTINQAGSFRLPSGAEIIGARQVGQQGLIWTDIELWSMQYISQPYVYSFNKIGQGVGLIGKYAHGVMAGITYWMSKSQFFWLSGGGVASIPCPIWDVAFQDLDLANTDKITCATNSMFKEITWYFPVQGGNGENSAYIKLNVSGLVLGQPPLWDYGTLDRSAWLDVSVLQQPIGYSPINQYIYQHEISPDADGAAMGESFTTGWFAVAEADVMPYVDQIWPDFKWGYFGQSQNANLTFTLSGQDYPGQSAQTIGPYTINQATTYISPRMRHRMLSFTVSGTGTGTWWRLGGMRFRYQPDGRF